MPVRHTGFYGINGREWCREWRWITGSKTLMSYSIILKLACYGAAVALCLVTMAANLNFGLSLGSTPEEKLIYAIASVAADIIKCTAVIVVIRLWQKRQRMLACVGTVFGIMCLSWSLASATGFALSSREHTAAMHAATSNMVQGWTTTIRRSGEQLALVERARAPSVVEAELAGQLVPAAIWKRTQGCSELTLSESSHACARVLALRQELAAAKSAQALETRIDEARQQLATTPVVGQSADPQVTGLAAMLGTEQATLRRGLALLLAVLVELGSAVGFALAHAATANPPPAGSYPPHRTDTPPRLSKAPKAAARNPAPAAVVSFAEQAARLKRDRQPTAPSDQSLDRFAEECMQRDNDGCVGARNAYAAYCRWADHVGVDAVTETRFGRFLTAEVKAMGGSKLKRRGGTVYIGIRITDALHMQPARMAA
jgi:hypothetical protein